MMDFAELRTSAIRKWFEGDATELVDLTRANRLNRVERDFVAQIVGGNPPKRQRGRKATSRNPVRAGLIRFWLRDVDGFQGEDSHWRQIEQTLGVSTTAARGFLEQLDNPKTQSQKRVIHLLKVEIALRKVIVASGDRDLIKDVRASDLKPISEK